MAEPEVRIFEKKIGDEIDTRNVTSASAAVEAKFDGYVEKTSAGKTSGGKTSGSAANNAG